MSAGEDKQRAERALDALMVLAFLLEGPGDVEPPPDPDGPEPVLSPEHRRALDALGPDLVERIVKGLPRWPAERDRKPARKTRRRKPTVTGSLHRGKADDELTDEARAEMERKVRELDAEDKRESEP